MYCQQQWTLVNWYYGLEANHYIDGDKLNKKPSPSPQPSTSTTALYGGKKQNAEISWKTVLNKMVQKNAFAEEEAVNAELYVG